ncbi:MAG: hypothetical protein IPN60_12245 [Saprospiraceae bacterium]|nr:hypothetical protein [Candidatus Opimibacter skivensis]
MESYWPFTAADKTTATKHDIEHFQMVQSSQSCFVKNTNAGRRLSNTSAISNNLSERINEIKQQAGGDILLLVARLPLHLMQHNLIGGHWLFVNPIILG